MYPIWCGNSNDLCDDDGDRQGGNKKPDLWPIIEDLSVLDTQIYIYSSTSSQPLTTTHL